MVELTRFNGSRFYLNVTHVETVEATPDTVITLTNGKKYLVRETADEVAAKITALYQSFPVSSVVPRPADESKE